VFSRVVVTVVSVIVVVVVVSIFIIVVVTFVVGRASVAGVSSCAPGWEWSPCFWALWYWRAGIKKAGYQLVPIFYIRSFVNPAA